MDGSELMSASERGQATPLRDVSLGDRFDLSKNDVLLSGVQAMIRAALAQKVRDRTVGWNTAGYITGYRGSPLGGVDMTAWKATSALAAHEVTFEPGLNEDIAATAIWGAQQAHLRGQGTHEGVFAMWYGKGPGLDRSGDVFRHANLAGVAPKGGVLVAMGDDHTCESSTSCHQTEITLTDAHIPVLHPAGPQEILDYTHLGWAMSRFTGCWVGFKCVKDTVEATTVVDGDPHRISVILPDYETPPQGLNIILGETPHQQEDRLVNWRLPAVTAFARANKLDRRMIGAPGARIGVISSGKSWLDVLQAFAYLGIDEAEAQRLGVTAYKIGMAYPLEQEGVREFAHGLETIAVVEEKRAFIETQVKEALYSLPNRPTVVGKKDEQGQTLFRQTLDLNPLEIALSLGRELLSRSPNEPRIQAAMHELEAMAKEAGAPALAERLPYFCSGCPHNTSTRVPEGSRASAGIGCHYMVQWMDRETTGFTHMGGEGANWIGEAKFSKEDHIFQNIGDGTYNHSGLMSIRAASDSGVNITYKVLYNDAVAMTGGQKNDGGLTPYQVADELLAARVRKLVVVVDPKEDLEVSQFPAAASIRKRDELDAVQRELREIPGCTAILYIQTCAAEKRRRRKRGTFPVLDQKVFINELVCEGCGDCGRKSNCVSILPKETEFGRKRQIDQSSCNKDLSCIDGFCPSFVTLHGAEVKKQARADFRVPDLPDPDIPSIDGTYNLLVTGVGGTGVVTVGALLGMAAHLEGKGSGVMEMAGLAQKGGAVMIHCRIGETPGDVASIRVQPGEADAVIGGDLVVAAAGKALDVMRKGRTGVVANDFEIITGDFTRDIDFSLPMRGLKHAIATKVGAERTQFFNATKLAEKLLGDAIYSNVLMLGAAWQAGLVPLSKAALVRAIELNGAGVTGNLAAFEIGRWAIADPAVALAQIVEPQPEALTLDALVEKRAAYLTDYQDAAWADRYREAVGLVRRAEKAVAPDEERLSIAAAKSLFKLMSYKDEYEVARLHSETLEKAVADRFEGVRKIEFHLAPPLIARKGSDGKPRKIAFGPWMMGAFKVLRRAKVLRGTPLDPFGWTAERRMERALIDRFERDLEEVARELRPGNHDLAVRLAEIPMEIRGFGHVKEANAAEAAIRRAGVMARFRGGLTTESGPAVKLAAE